MLTIKRLSDHGELIYFLVRSELVTRYKQTFLGPAWVILEPIIQMIVFTLVFRRVRETDLGVAVAYPVFLYAGLLPWTYFRFGLTRTANTLVHYEAMVQRVYFPRQLLLVSEVIAAQVDFVISFGILVVLMILYSVPFRLEMLAIVPLLFGIAALIFGLALFLSIWNARYRDIRQMLPYILYVGMFLSPVVYSPNFLPPEYQWVFSLNPLTGYLTAFRAAVVGTPWSPVDLQVSVAITVVLVLAGLAYFRKNIDDAIDVL